MDVYQINNNYQKIPCWDYIMREHQKDQVSFRTKYFWKIEGKSLSRITNFMLSPSSKKTTENNDKLWFIKTKSSTTNVKKAVRMALKMTKYGNDVIMTNTRLMALPGTYEASITQTTCYIQGKEVADKWQEKIVKDEQIGGKLLEVDNVKMIIISYQMNKRPQKEDYHKTIKVFTRKQITQKKLVVYEQNGKITQLGTDLHKQLVNMTAGECKIRTKIKDGRYWNECTQTNSSVIWVTMITDKDIKGEFKNFLVMKEVYVEVKHGSFPINVEVKPQLTLKRRAVQTEQTMQFIWEQYVCQRIYLRRGHAVITENALLYVPTTQMTYEKLQELQIQYTHLIQMLQYTTLQEQMNQYRSEHPSDASYILNNTLVIVSHYAKLKYKCHYGKEVLVFVLKSGRIKNEMDSSIRKEQTGRIYCENNLEKRSTHKDDPTRPT